MNEIAYGIGEATDEKVVFSFSTEGMHKPITNGDIIKAVFPSAEVDADPYSPSVDIRCGGTLIMRVDRNVWNAPYRREENVKND